MNILKPHRKNTDETSEYVDFAKLALLEDEYQRLTAQGESELKGWKKWVDDYFISSENRQKQRVKKNIYLLLTIFTGIVGGHRFYEKRYKLGILYLCLAITGLPIAFSLVDLLIAVPIKADEENYIWI